MLSLSAASIGFNAPALAPVASPRAATARMETVADLEALAKKLNPVCCPHAPL